MAMARTFVLLLAAALLVGVAAANKASTNAACDDLDKSACETTAGCVWCLSAAVPSSCYTEEDARRFVGTDVCGSHPQVLGTSRDFLCS
jgi:hypothetical protein